MESFRFKVDEICLAGGRIEGWAEGTFEAEEFDYEPSNLEITSYEMFSPDAKVELSEAEKAELEAVVYEALSGAERHEGVVSVSAISVSL